MNHPIDIEIAIAQFWQANLSGKVLRFSKAGENDVVPYTVMSTISAPGRSKRGPARTSNSEYPLQWINVKAYHTNEHDAGLLSKEILAPFREANIAGILQIRVIDDGHPIEEEQDLWYWHSILSIEYSRSR